MEDDDVLFIHSHKFLNTKGGAKETDFVICNLTHGYILVIEVKFTLTANSIDKASKQIKESMTKLKGILGKASSNFKSQCL